MTNPRNAVAIRFRPLIDVDVDKTTHQVVRVDVDFSDSLILDAYDYDLEDKEVGVNPDFEVEGGSPIYAAALEFVTRPFMPHIRAAMADAAHAVGATYHDSVGRDDPPPSTARADLILAVQVYAGLRDSWSLTDDEKAAVTRAMSLAKVDP